MMYGGHPFHYDAEDWSVMGMNKKTVLKFNSFINQATGKGGQTVA